MLSFEDRQRLRALSQPVAPQRDLWPSIAARLDMQPRALRRRFVWLAAAASLAGVALLSGVFATRKLHSDKTEHVALVQPQHPAIAIAAADNPAARWNPSDPRLRGAAIELRAAQGELRQALAIAPHSDYLERLLDRTRRQQARLKHLDLDAG